MRFCVFICLVLTYFNYASSNKKYPYSSTFEEDPTTVTFETNPFLAKKAENAQPGFTDIDSVECETNPLNMELRLQLLNDHNFYRSILANGEAEMPDNQFASSAANMYKLKYSCKLENMAQEWANKNIIGHNKNRTIPSGENWFMEWRSEGDGGGEEESVENEVINQTSIYWWNELIKFGGISTSNVTFTKALSELGIGHWSQMAWGKAQFIGCGLSVFPNTEHEGYTNYFVVCNYYPQGNVLGSPIYEIGYPCKKDSECTTLPNSICVIESGLCYAN